MGGFGLGALIFSYLAAKIVNPFNLSSSVNEQGLIVFDEAVTSQVPHMLQTCAIGYALVVILAVLLASEPAKETEQASDDDFRVASTVDLNSSFTLSVGNSGVTEPTRVTVEVDS